MANGWLRCKLAAKAAVGFVRLVTHSHQKIAVAALAIGVLARADVFAVDVFDTFPLLETMLRRNFIAKMPLPKVPSSVVGIRQDLRNTVGVLGERNIVLDAAVAMWPKPSQDAGTGRRAD